MLPMAMAPGPVSATGNGGPAAGSSTAMTRSNSTLPSWAAAGPSSGRPSAGQVTKVAIRDGKRISVNDHVYISAPWAPGAGEPYLIARVMEFVTASSSRSGATPLASSSGTLQVRVNTFLRTRDISHRISTDSRLLVATMHSDVFALDNVRGLCEVRHRDLLGDAPEVSAWKKREDHFYYYQLYDRYIHRFYDVIPMAKLQNAPADVLETLRRRYSFVIAEVGMAADLCDALRGCAVCQQWASATETVRCDTCKKFFHMRCLNPPLASKPAKGYSWTCAPCSRKHEQTVALELGSGSSDDSMRLTGIQVAPVRGANGATSANSNGQISEIGHQVKLKTSSGRAGRPRGSGRRALDDAASTAGTPDGTPVPEKTLDDVRGTRCFNRWPYRYFGQHTNAPDVLDPHDSIYPRATTRLGPKYQASLPSWEQQKELGLGVVSGLDADSGGAPGTSSGPADDDLASSSSAGRGGHVGRAKRGRGRGRRGGAAFAARDSTSTATAVSADAETPGTTPVLAPAALPSDGSDTKESAILPAATPIREFERGTDDSIEVICNVSVLGAGHEDKTALQDAYMTSAAWHFRPLAPYNLDFINRAVKIFNDHRYEPIAALQEVSRSTPEDFRIVHWTSRERKAFDAGVKDWGSEMKHLKKLVPTKKVADIVRYFVQWKNEKLKEQHASERAAIERARAKGKPPPVQERDTVPRSQTMTRAVSPALSVFEEKAVKDAPTISCKMCSSTASPFWYKGPWSWTNRFLCDSCGLYWRRYAAEAVNADLIATTSRKHAASVDDNSSLGVAPPIKVAKLSAKPGDSVKTGLATITAAADAAKTATPPPPPIVAAVPKPDPIRCVLCRKLEPKRRLQQCRQCSLSVHQGCFGLTDEEVNADIWLCDCCTNEKALDAALVPRCILCPPLMDVPMPRGDTILASSGSRGRNGKSGSAAALVSSPSANVNGNSTQANGVVAEQPLTALDAVKPTECNNWAHLLCAAWMPDIVFTDTKRMKLVEGAGNLPWWRYSASCEICRRPGGACVQCSEASCKRTFHISCACVNASYSMAFEINPVKTSRRDQIATAAFKAEQGHWSALVFCKTHRELAKEKQTYDFSEVDPRTGLTALQTYARSHKNVGGHVQASVLSVASSGPAAGGSPGSSDSTYALLRRAKRFDAVLGEFEGQPNGYIRHHSGNVATVRSPVSPGMMNGSARDTKDKAMIVGPQTSLSTVPTTPQHRKKPRHCFHCGTTWSPFWWDIGDAVAAAADDNGIKRDAMPIDSPLHNGSALSSSAVDAEASRVCCNLCRSKQQQGRVDGGTATARASLTHAREDTAMSEQSHHGTVVT